MARITVTVRVFGQRGTRRLRLQARARIADLLKSLGYNPEVVATRRNGKIVAEGERLASGDLVEIIPIVTGG